MSYRYVLLEAAQLDYEESVLWYQDRSQQAAENFVKEVNKGFQLICAYPLQSCNKYKKFYEFNLRIFPFSIIYTIEKEQLIVITRIYHHKRNPKNKYKK